MPIVLALAAASFWGTSNFLGGMTSRKVSPLIVTLWTTSANFAVVLVAATLLHDFIAADVVWGVVAGVSGTAGMLLMYDAMSRGRMSVVAPTIAVLAAAVAFAAGLLDGDRPAPLAYGGVASAVIAVVCLSRRVEDHDTMPPEHLFSGADERRAVLAAMAAGTLFGISFFFISRVTGDSGVWVLVGQRVTMIGLLFVLVVARRASIRPAGAQRTMVASGLIQAAGDVAFQYAIYTGALSLVSVIASLNPAMTVLLARTVLHERLQLPQLAGVVFALFAVAGIAAG